MHRLHVAWTALLAGCLSPPLRKDFERLEAAIGESARKQQQAPAAAAAPRQTGDAPTTGAEIAAQRVGGVAGRPPLPPNLGLRSGSGGLPRPRTSIKVAA